MRKIFLPPELYDGVKDLSYTDKGKLFDYFYKYNLGIDFEIKEDSLKIIFGFYKPFFDNDIKRHKLFLESRKTNGSKGGRPKKDWENEQKPKKANKPKKPSGNEVKGNEYNNTINNNKIYISNKEDITSLLDNEYIQFYGKGLKCLWMFIETGYKIEKKESEIKKFIEWLKSKAEIYGYITPEGTIYWSELVQRFDRWKERHEDNKKPIQKHKSSILVFLDDKGKQKK